MIEQWVKENSPEGVYQRLSDFRYNHLTTVSSVADSIRIIGPEHIYDEEYYVKRQGDPWRSDAHAIASAIEDEFEPESVIDFGCAIGNHLERFYESGLDIKGVEGNPRALQHATVPSMHLDHHDLRDPYETKDHYDVVLCFEVAEHIPEPYADTLVRTISNAGSTVIMTAATPGQRGTHHVNLQPRAYWIAKFSEQGLSYDEESVTALRESIDVEETTWITQNLMVFQ